MLLRRYKDIVAIKTDQEIWGFHARNLEMARLDEAAWNAFNGPRANDHAHDEIAAWNTQDDPEVKNDHLPQSVRSLVINITQFCNLRCTYCAAGGDGTYGPNKGAKGKVDLQKVQAQLKKFIDATADGESFSVQFFGGEPLLHPEAIQSLANYSKLLVAGRNVELKFSITTNGTMITPEVAELLASIRCNITLSLDGPPEINDRMRPSAGGKGSTQKVLRGLENLIAIRDRLSGIGINCVVGSHNMKVVEAYKFFQPFDFDFINFIYAVDEADRIYSDEYVSQMQEIFRLAHKHGGERELRKFPFLDHYFATLDGKVRTINHCGAGKSLLYTDTKADLYTCNWFMDDPNEIVGRENQMFEDKIADYSDPLIEKHGCTSCWARFLCGGGCMFVNKVKMGNKHVSDPHYCKRTRSLIASGLTYYPKYRISEPTEGEEPQAV